MRFLRAIWAEVEMVWQLTFCGHVDLGWSWDRHLVIGFTAAWLVLLGTFLALYRLEVFPAFPIAVLVAIFVWLGIAAWSRGRFRRS